MRNMVKARQATTQGRATNNHTLHQLILSQQLEEASTNPIYLYKELVALVQAIKHNHCRVPLLAHQTRVGAKQGGEFLLQPRAATRQAILEFLEDRINSTVWVVVFTQQEKFGLKQAEFALDKIVNKATYSCTNEEM